MLLSTLNIIATLSFTILCCWWEAQCLRDSHSAEVICFFFLEAFSLMSSKSSWAGIEEENVRRECCSSPFHICAPGCTCSGPSFSQIPRKQPPSLLPGLSKGFSVHSHFSCPVTSHSLGLESRVLGRAGHPSLVCHPNGNRRGPILLRPKQIIQFVHMALNPSHITSQLSIAVFDTVIWFFQYFKNLQLFPLIRDNYIFIT